MNLCTVIDRDEARGGNPHMVSLAGYLRVSEPVTAFKKVELFFDRHKGMRPVIFPVFYVEISSAHIRRRIVESVTENSSQACVTDETVPAALIGYQREKVLGSKVVNPRIRRFRSGDYIFPLFIIKIPIFHFDKYSYDVLTSSII